jgi:hypothetical protein
MSSAYDHASDDDGLLPFELAELDELCGADLSPKHNATSTSVTKAKAKADSTPNVTSTSIARAKAKIKAKARTAAAKDKNKTKTKTKADSISSAASALLWGRREAKGDSMSSSASEEEDADDSSGDDATYMEIDETDNAHKMAAYLLKAPNGKNKGLKVRGSSSIKKKSIRMHTPIYREHVSCEGKARNYSLHATPSKYRTVNLVDLRCEKLLSERRDQIKAEYAHDPDFAQIIIKRVNTSQSSFRANENQVILHGNYHALEHQNAQLKTQLATLKDETVQLTAQIKTLKALAVVARATINDMHFRNQMADSV